MRPSGAILNKQYWTWIILRHVFGQNALHFKAGIHLTLPDLKPLKQFQAVTRFLEPIVSSKAWKASDSSKSLAFGPWKSWSAVLVWPLVEISGISFHTHEKHRETKATFVCVFSKNTFFANVCDDDRVVSRLIVGIQQKVHFLIRWILLQIAQVAPSWNG